MRDQMRNTARLTAPVAVIVLIAVATNWATQTPRALASPSTSAQALSVHPTQSTSSTVSATDATSQSLNHSTPPAVTPLDSDSANPPVSSSTHSTSLATPPSAGTAQIASSSVELAQLHGYAATSYPQDLATLPTDPNQSFDTTTQVAQDLTTADATASTLLEPDTALDNLWGSDPTLADPVMLSVLAPTITSLVSPESGFGP
jgi:hypothetical protein